MNPLVNGDCLPSFFTANTSLKKIERWIFTDTFFSRSLSPRDSVNLQSAQRTTGLAAFFDQTLRLGQTVKIKLKKKN